MSTAATLPQRTKRAIERDPDVLKVSDGNFLVEGRSRDWYAVNTTELECTCPDSTIRGEVCYHLRAAALKDARGDVELVSEDQR